MSLGIDPTAGHIRRVSLESPKQNVETRVPSPSEYTPTKLLCHPFGCVTTALPMGALRLISSSNMTSSVKQLLLQKPKERFLIVLTLCQPRLSFFFISQSKQKAILLQYNLFVFSEHQILKETLLCFVYPRANDKPSPTNVLDGMAYY